MWAYIFGGICPRKGKGAGLVLPYCDTEAMQDHLAEISQAVDPGAHAVLILDQAGWHVTPKLRVPDNMSLMFLPPRSPNSTRSKTSGSSCGTTGYRTGSSKTTTISSTNAAVLGTGSSINLGKSCPSECGNGRIGHDQRPLVLYIWLLRQDFCSRFPVQSGRSLKASHGSLRCAACPCPPPLSGAFRFTSRGPMQCIKRGL
jgi:hypothetical protein